MVPVSYMAVWQRVMEISMVNNFYLYISKQNNPQRKMITHLNHPTRKAKWSCMPVWTHVALIRGQGKAIPFIVFLLFPQIHNCFIIPNRVTERHHRLSHTVCDMLRLAHIEKTHSSLFLNMSVKNKTQLNLRLKYSISLKSLLPSC